MKVSSYKFKLMSGSSSHTSFNSAGEKDKVLQVELMSLQCDRVTSRCRCRSPSVWGEICVFDLKYKRPSTTATASRPQSSRSRWQEGTWTLFCW